MNITTEIHEYAAATAAMRTGEAKSIRLAAITDARHFTRQGRTAEARKTLARAAREAEES